MKQDPLKVKDGEAEHTCTSQNVLKTLLAHICKCF